MLRVHQLLLLSVMLILVATACGGDDGAEGETTSSAAATTTTPPETTTTAATATRAETTTTVATTTTAAETTTTVATTTTAVESTTTTTSGAAVPGAGSEVVTAKVEAATAAAPAGWTSTPIGSDLSAAESDEVYGECAGPDAFDLSDLNEATAAIATVEINGEPEAGSFFPPPSASIEARVFESVDVAAEAFAVLETVIGTDEGRNCLVDQFIELIGRDAPADAQFDISIEEATVAGADVGARLTIAATAEGLTLEFEFDLVAARDGDCTVYGAFFSFGDFGFDPATRDAIFSAAASA